MTHSNLQAGSIEASLVAQAQGPYRDFDFSCVPSLNRDRVSELFSGEFVDNGENIVIVGPHGVGKSHLAMLIGGGVASRGKTVRFIYGDQFGGWRGDESLIEPSTLGDPKELGVGNRRPRDEYLECDLLVLNEVPEPNMQIVNIWAREMFGMILTERARLGRSTLIASIYTPREWAENDNLGLGTHRLLTQAHMGIFLSRWDPTQTPLLDRVCAPTEGEDLALFNSMGRFPMSATSDPSLLTEYFQVTAPERRWHFFDIKDTTWSYKRRLAAA